MKFNASEAYSYHAGNFSERVAMYVCLYVCHQTSVGIYDESIIGRRLKFGLQLYIYCF